VGQAHLIGPDAPFRRSLETGRPGSFILWGPPGSGKTTLALITAEHVQDRFVRFSAVTGGVADVRRIVEQARELRKASVGTMLFVDEIHRFNRAQQDAFLPHVENGTIRLVGATTENPSFNVNAPLLSRCTVYVLNALNREDLLQMLKRVTESPRFRESVSTAFSAEALEFIAAAADGDARRCLNILEQLVTGNPEGVVTLSAAADLISSQPLLYDRSGEEHYNLISALHKSIRSSDPDASLYWLARMFLSGENPLYIGRRMIRLATEDIGLADPSALTVAMRAVDAYRFLGSPEGDLALAEAVIYLACAPKSNSVYEAWNRVQKSVVKSGSLPVPLHLRNAPTRLMKELDYGMGYQYAHSIHDGIVTHSSFPVEMNEEEYYSPSASGREAAISKTLQLWKEAREKRRMNERKGNG
jgi:putative ATPase